jgi:ParB-like chromosome segregation protein Spo0J
VNTHPVAQLFPLLQKGTPPWNDLVESIRNYGLLEPLVLDGDTLLDGRNRLAACEALEIAPRFIQWKTLPLGPDVDAAGWIVAKNLDRRHLTDDQKAMIYTEFLRWDTEQEAAKKKAEAARNANPSGKPLNPNPDSRPRDISEMNANSTRGKIAAEAKISRHKAAMAIQLDKAVDNGTAPSELREEVKAGAVPLAKAVKKIKPKPTIPKVELSLRERFDKWWPKLLSKKWAAADIPQIKTWIQKELSK